MAEPSTNQPGKTGWGEHKHQHHVHGLDDRTFQVVQQMLTLFARQAASLKRLEQGLADIKAELAKQALDKSKLGELIALQTEGKRKLDAALSASAETQNPV